MKKKYDYEYVYDEEGNPIDIIVHDEIWQFGQAVEALKKAVWEAVTDLVKKFFSIF